MNDILNKHLNQLSAEMNNLIAIKEQYQAELNRIDTRMTQIIGAIQILQQINNEITVDPGHQPEVALTPHHSDQTQTNQEPQS